MSLKKGACSLVYKSRHQTSTLFALLLYSAFTMFSLIIILHGAKIYLKTIKASSDRNDMRASVLYVSNKLRSSDTADFIHIENRKGINILVLQNNNIETLIYFKDGILYEMVAFTGDEFKPDYGEKITEIKDFSISEEKGMFIVKSTDKSNNEYISYTTKRTPTN